MMARWMGAGLILIGCGVYGSSLVRRHRAEEAMMRSLLYALQWMQRQLRYQLTPLPELCRQAAGQISSPLGRILLKLSQALEQQTALDVPGCMDIALRQSGEVSAQMRQLLTLLGSSLGCFDLSGQLEGLRDVQSACEERLSALREGRENRLRSYQTLSLCAGAALVILLI